jgi:hypothetical protein
MWNRKTQMRGLIPSPTCGMRKALAKEFTVIDTPEPYTTKTCSKCMVGEMKEVMKRPHPNPKKRQQDPNCTLDVRGSAVAKMKIAESSSIRTTMLPSTYEEILFI